MDWLGFLRPFIGLCQTVVLCEVSRVGGVRISLMNVVMGTATGILDLGKVSPNTSHTLVPPLPPLRSSPVELPIPMVQKPLLSTHTLDVPSL
jgi:hypothetical protein